MSESPFRERRFSPAEVRSLVRRAAEIAARPSAGEATGSALTAQEIEGDAATSVAGGAEDDDERDGEAATHARRADR